MIPSRVCTLPSTFFSFHFLECFCFLPGIKAIYALCGYFRQCGKIELRPKYYLSVKQLLAFWYISFSSFHCGFKDEED